ncbi:unnamed protein product [Anisakis simplex]|uniref:Tetraspanin-12 n=1 Tax=Anisakis simplex TaxID=6269 RepID=A0A0M3JZC2_ANISI|nr:unnamed protein product [Anisakis simplex]
MWGAVCMGIVVVCVCVVGAVWLRTSNEISESLDYLVQKYYQGAGSMAELVDLIQHQFKCCGNAGCSDYRAFYMDIPRSCDLRCEGCSYRIMVALRVLMTVSLVIAVFVVFIGGRRRAVERVRAQKSVAEAAS